MKRVLILLIAAISTLASAQEPPKEPAKPAMAPLVRLQAAKTAYIKNVEGSDIGVDTITSTLEGWGRYKLVDSPDKADLLIEVTSPDEGSGGVSVSSSAGPSRTSGRYEQSTHSSRELSTGSGTMRLVVRDAKTKLTLWGASEPVKGAVKKNTRENNLVEAAQTLAGKFHDRVEPVGSSNK
ncbi:MAG: hypothetical protein ACRD3E_14265 [Terriglobales bacterium]